ncbi:MAG: SagB/ThcOx family dehydrogenase [Anaerolineae bacterium]|nr:SagB/ThcOx family dehydrogenase [Anaerolineae bacterium]
MKGIGRDFMQKTQYDYLEPSDQTMGLPQPPLFDEPDPDREQFDLPDPSGLHLPPVDLVQLITDRRTLRRYADDPISPAELSTLLWCTQGVKRVTGRPSTQRTVPSAGARHAFETYLLFNRVEGFDPGLYHYLSGEHRLEAVDLESTIADRITESALSQKQVQASAVTFLWVADVYRMAWRYGERGYRYLHLDAGHVCQNLYLIAEALGCGVCAIAAYDDEGINTLLGLDGETRFVIYVATVGKK